MSHESLMAGKGRVYVSDKLPSSEYRRLRQSVLQSLVFGHTLTKLTVSYFTTFKAPMFVRYLLDQMPASASRYQCPFRLSPNPPL